MELELDPAIAAHYRHGLEHERLAVGNRLEAVRTSELLERFLPRPPAVVVDVGGGTGAYALPLARAGYEVHLLDAFEPHVRQARAGSEKQPDAPLRLVTLGDARALPFSDATADALLLFGPLYHLPDAGDRVQALNEARRVLRPDGVLLAAAISRFASTYDGIRTGAIANPLFEQIVTGDLQNGVHDNPDPQGRPEWFTLAYFHRPDELLGEVRDAGFAHAQVLAIEGPGAFRDVDAMLAEPEKRDALLRAIRRVESEPELLGASSHLMVIAH